MNKQTPFGDLINKPIKIPDTKTKQFDYSNEYTVTKKTRNGIRKEIKPELVQQIKKRLMQG